MLETHPCPISGCREACPKHHLMCVAHWRMVPKILQDEVYAAHRPLRRRGATLEQVKAHRSAARRAIDAVTSKLKLNEERARAKQPGFFL